MIKNTFILREEVSRLIENIPDKYKQIKQSIIFIYEQGYRVNESIDKSKSKYDKRTFQRVIKRYSNGLISFSDLRRSYVLSHPVENKQRRKSKDIIGARLRWKVLSKDNFRCVACGIDSQSEILHVDHIIPLSLGGETIESNLRTLCCKCNMGRGNILLESDIKSDTYLKKENIGNIQMGDTK